MTLALILFGFVIAFALGFVIGALLGQRHSEDD